MMDQDILVSRFLDETKGRIRNGEQLWSTCDPPEVILISLKAGGEGLNLQARKMLKIWGLKRASRLVICRICCLNGTYEMS